VVEYQGIHSGTTLPHANGTHNSRLYIRQAKKRRSRAPKSSGNNVADDVLEVIRITTTHPFVRKAFHSKGQTPMNVLYTDEQLADLKRFCCSNVDGGVRSVMGVNRTFNLGPFCNRRRLH